MGWLRGAVLSACEQLAHLYACLHKKSSLLHWCRGRQAESKVGQVVNRNKSAMLWQGCSAFCFSVG